MNSNRKKLLAPILVTVFLTFYFIVYFGFLISLLNGFIRLVLGILPIVFAIVTVYVCVQRIKEIRSGEEDDLSQY
jgi:ribose/xylose/arabinose/galactoside ABC-type transport system permease subunit